MYFLSSILSTNLSLTPIFLKFIHYPKFIPYFPLNLPYVRDNRENMTIYNIDIKPPEFENERKGMLLLFCCNFVNFYLTKFPFYINRNDTCCKSVSDFIL